MAKPSAARQRIVDAAYELFSRNGLRAVGVDTIIAESGVAKMTLYRNFASKDELILEFLRVREERWTRDWLQAEAERRARTPEGRLLAIFDVFDEWFRLDDFEGCSFVNVLLEVTDLESPVRRASVQHLATIRTFVLALLIGIVSGTYSSIFNASPLLVVWHEWEDRRHGRTGSSRAPRTRRVAS